MPASSSGNTRIAIAKERFVRVCFILQISPKWTTGKDGDKTNVETNLRTRGTTGSSNPNVIFCRETNYWAGVSDTLIAIIDGVKYEDVRAKKLRHQVGFSFVLKGGELVEVFQDQRVVLVVQRAVASSLHFFDVPDDGAVFHQVVLHAVVV